MNTLGKVYQYNKTRIQKIQDFADIVPQTDEVLFIQISGVCQDYLKSVEYVDDTLCKKTQQENKAYIRITGLPKLTDYSDVNYYTDAYNRWNTDSERKFYLKSYENDVELAKKLGELCYEIQQIFNATPNVTDSISKNFIIKLMFWMDNIRDFLKDSGKKQCKFVINNVSKKQESLFCYGLTLLGVNVMVLLPDLDMEAVGQFDDKVNKVVLGNKSKINIPEYNPVKYALQQNNTGSRIVLDRPERKQNTSTALPEHNRAVHNNVFNNVPNKELEFEELALLASSVVMIAVGDKDGKIISTGSGIMIGKNGYILTNNHVAFGGVIYAVRIEDDDTTYETTEVIKYNQHLDLAIIRINRELNPLPIYNRDKALVRGQKVVAIGSPLGLFNSVSNGIISGFRKMKNDVEMIQFTAPISSGSSGGAVLNMYGEVIGISTAGYDEGQNLNLAVGYSDILGFVKGFINT